MVYRLLHIQCFIVLNSCPRNLIWLALEALEFNLLAFSVLQSEFNSVGLGEVGGGTGSPGVPCFPYVAAWLLKAFRERLGFLAFLTPGPGFKGFLKAFSRPLQGLSKAFKSLSKAFKSLLKALQAFKMLFKAFQRPLKIFEGLLKAF